MLSEKFDAVINQPEIQCLKGCTQSPIWHPEGDVFEHTMLVFKHTEGCCDEVRLAALLHDTGKPETRVQTGDRITNHKHEWFNKARVVMTRLDIPGVDVVEWLCRNHMIHNWHRRREFKRKRLMDNPWFPMLIQLHRADCLGSMKDAEHADEIEREYNDYRGSV